MSSRRGNERARRIVEAANGAAGEQVGTRGVLQRLLSGIKDRFRDRSNPGESHEQVLGEHVELPKELLKAISDARLMRPTRPR